MRSVFRLVLAAQALGDFAGQTSQRLAGSIHNIPVTFHAFRFRAQGFHAQSASTFKKLVMLARGPFQERGFYPICQDKDKTNLSSAHYSCSNCSGGQKPLIPATPQAPRARAST